MSINGSVLGIIPARAGSKGVPGKNFRKIADKPLIQWTIEAAINSSLIDHIIVSTDDPRIIEIAKNFDLEIISRPPQLATDEAVASDVIAHAIAGKSNFDVAVYLQPTSPCRTSKNIDNAINLLRTGNCEAVISTSAVQERPEWMYELDRNGYLYSPSRHEEVPRQKLKPLFLINGAIYCGYLDALRSKNCNFMNLSAKGMEMSPSESVDIDTELDFGVAENYLIQVRNHL